MWASFGELVMDSVGLSVLWVINVISLKTTNQSPRSLHHLACLGPWLMVTPVIRFSLWNNRKLSRKNETIIYNGNAQIFRGRRWVPLWCFIEFSSLFPFSYPTSLTLSGLSITHTVTYMHAHAHQSVKKYGFLHTPQGSVDPCARLNLTLVTAPDRGKTKEEEKNLHGKQGVTD